MSGEENGSGRSGCEIVPTRPAPRNLLLGPESSVFLQVEPVLKNRSPNVLHRKQV